MDKNFVLAYDLGTSGVKASVVDYEGRIGAMVTETYPLYTPREAWAEQEPEDYWRAVCAATKAVLAKAEISPHDVKAMAFSSQWKGIIPLDRDNRVLHRCIIWLDSRAEKQAKELNRVMQLNYFKEKFIGGKPSSKLNAALGRNVVCGADYWPKLKWLRDEMPEIYRKTAVILDCCSYVKWRATGNMLSDMTSHFTKSYSKASQSTYDMILKLCKVNPQLFPPITLTTDKAGELTAQAAAEMGLEAGIPVFGGSGDIPAISVGSGCCELGSTHAYFGSSGWLASMVKSQEGFLSVSPFSKELDLLCFGFQAIGLSFDWTVEQLYHREKEEMGEGIYAFLQEELKNVPAGSKGLLASHWIFGERPPFFGSDARGVFVNLNSQHDRRYMLNAMMESVCYSMKLALEALENGTHRPIQKLNAVGGGTLNAHWMQMLADVLQIPVCIPQETRHSGTIGTAYCALIGLGVCKDFCEAQKRIEIVKVYEPNPANRQIYAKMCEEYKKLYKSMKPVFGSLGKEA